ncbi:MAG TPA: phenylalanine--tRNA ligase subunit beta [Actinomycetota bacterium]|nr:phenylalanine--tRNA ligase subunit beta [Actinomycetota bacterium]
MRVPLGWLSDYVDVDVGVDELCRRLDFSGTKVEAVRRPAGSLGGIVVAQVDAIHEHPNADSLTLVDVHTDAGEQRVVCGARNFAPGDRVPLATVGARLPGMEVGERRIRGETSRGMLCSPAELGISKDHSGILVLPPDAALGADVVDVLGLDDTIVELEVSANRGDCMGLVGIAREVAALLGTELRVPDARVGADGDNPVSVDVQDARGCPRYVARFVAGVAPGPAPAWMAARLLAAGLRPVSNVVDVTNYVMVETGQPLHAFDAACIDGHTIVVRRAHAGEKLTTLDGVERSLDPGDLTIADPRRALALAGVMGGVGSEVSPDTRDVVLESAAFDAESVARTSRRHVLRTDASTRFERGTDPDGAAFAAARAAAMLRDVAGGAPASRVVDAYPVPVRRPTLTLRPARTNAVLGIDVDADEQARHLRSIGFDVSPGDASLAVRVPSWRSDVEREIDLVEEVGRLAGFDRLPETLPPGRAGGLEPRQASERRVRRALAGFGLHEAWTSAFGSARDLDDLGLDEEHPARRVVELANPMSADESVLRTSLLPGLLRAVGRNAARGARSVALFEIAHVYEPGAPGDLPREPLVLAAVVAGDRDPRSWHSGRTWDYFGAKGVLEATFEALGVETPGAAPVAHMPFHPTRAAQVTFGGGALGALGELHPEVCERFGVPERAAAFEVALDPVLDAVPERVAAPDLPRFPAVYVDVAVVVDDAVPAQTVGDVVARAGMPEVVSAVLFDVYRGDQIPDGKKGLAYALELRSPERTLTDRDAAAVRDRIVGALRERTGAELRS